MLNDTSSNDHAFKDLYLRDEAPPHPGEVLRDDILPLTGLSRAAIAKRLGITTRRLSQVLAEKTPVTADLAIRLGALFGYGARYWLGLQMQHDLWVTQQPVTYSIRPLDWKKSQTSGKGEAGRSRSAGYR